MPRTLPAHQLRPRKTEEVGVRGNGTFPNCLFPAGESWPGVGRPAQWREIELELGSETQDSHELEPSLS